MPAVELVLLLLAAAACAHVAAARWGLAPPVLLVAGGLALALVPDLPRVTLDPAVLFLAFIPPVLFHAASTTSLRDLRREWQPILLLSVPLALASIAAVAWVVRLLDPATPLAAACVLGAIVATPDPVAALAALRSDGAPHRIARVLEGEGLVNDATALTAYRMALAALVTGGFSVGEAAQTFVVSSAGGVALGMGAGALATAVRRRVSDLPDVANTVSLLTPFATYLLAQRLAVSGVLAVVTAGIVVGRAASRSASPSVRLQGAGLWAVLTFVLESLTFILIGLELPHAWEGLAGRPVGHLPRLALAVLMTLMVVRLAWVAVSAILGHLLRPRRFAPIGRRWRELLLLGWSGARGGDSLIVALALPYATASGAPLPGRDLITFLTFTTIFGTLMLQGSTVGWLARRLRLRGDAHWARELRLARRAVARAAEAARAVETPVPGEAGHARRLRTIAAQHAALVRLRDAARISDDVLLVLQRDLDLEAALLASPHGRAMRHDRRALGHRSPER